MPALPDQNRQECMKAATDFLKRRLHSRRELLLKLNRQQFAPNLIEDVLSDLQRLGYINDERFARTKAMAAAEYRHHGRRRAFMELRKSGIPADIADRALDDVYEQTDAIAVARELAMKHAPRLRKLAPVTARRRLVGLLQRRGFDYEAIKPLIDEVLGIR